MEQFSFDGNVVETKDIPFPTQPSRKYKKPWEMFGYGPDGETCKTCTNRIEGRYNTKYLHKCPEWILSHSEATDIRLKWAACGKWKEKK